MKNNVYLTLCLVGFLNLCEHITRWIIEEKTEVVTIGSLVFWGIIMVMHWFAMNRKEDK